MKIKSKLSIIFFLILFFTYFTCSERQRLNPIDPQNPETGGKLQKLKIFSEYGQAILQWEKINLANLLGYKIYRKTNGDSAFKEIYLVDPDTNGFVDKNLNYEQRYAYKVSVLASDFESLLSDSVSIIPGPTFIWLSDVYNEQVIKLSHDCAHEISRIYVAAYPWSLKIDKNQGRLWYSDILLNRIYFFEIEKQQAYVFTELNGGEPIDFEIDQTFRRIWVADELNGSVLVLNFYGDTLQTISGFNQPVDIECYLKDGSCLVADISKQSITKISNDYQIDFQMYSANKPTSISINQSTGEFWVADNEGVAKYDEMGNQLIKIDGELDSPYKLAVDSQSGNCWVLAWDALIAKSQLFCFSATGEMLFAMAEFSLPENLVINPFDQSCILADSRAGSVIKLKSDGTIYGQISGYDYPYGLDVEF